MRTTFTRHRLIISILLVLLSSITIVHAIEQDQPFIMESWTLVPGSVLEVLAVSDTVGQQVAWSLTKADGTFVQADRGPLFRERFVEAGDFLLRAEVSKEDRTPVATRTFAIHIVPNAPTATDDNAGALVSTDPPQDITGNVALDVNAQTILLRTKPGSSSLNIDVNSDIDSSGDGDPTNDNDTRGTFFETEGAPLRLWFTAGRVQRTFTVRGNGTAGPATQVIRLYSGSIPPPVEISEQTPVISPNGLELVIIESHGSGSYAFSIDPSTLSSEGRALLFTWDFGDGRQSMLDQPRHTYPQNGQFTINVHVRDLATAAEVLRITGVLPVDSIQQVQQPGSDGGSSSASSQSSTSDTSSRFSLKTIASIIGGLLLAVLAGFTAVTIIGKLVQRRLDKEPPAAGVSGKKTSPSAGPLSLDLPPPMPVAEKEEHHDVIDVPTAPHQKESREEISEPAPTETEETPKLSELSFKEEEAPSWLKQGHEEAEKRGHTVESAPPPPEQEPAVAAPSQTEKKEPRPLPPWLEPAPSTPTESTPPPASITELPTTTATTSESQPPSSEPTPPVEAPSPTPAPTSPPSVPAPAIPPPVPTSPVSTPPEENAQADTAAQESEDTKKEKELSPAEREKRRKKRARYRANKKKREEATDQEQEPQKPAESEASKETIPSATAETEVSKVASPSAAEPEPKTEDQESDEPIAIIRAENISHDAEDKKES
ncbi:hypothetical protein AUJ46_05295 [Candidatus Peregrinibacteria bacterium CG1_02_54_53]|nr:MAG: hypothetical protein AUJ46_05295 [Candidatus Peregrinibacteria bacterium CG1_02_54_53]